MTHLRYTESDSVLYFSEDGELVYCSNIPCLMQMFDIQDEADDWRLFIDSPQTSLKAILFHNGKEYGSISAVHLIDLKETYEK